MIWKVIKSELTGTSHKKNNIPCQDVVDYLVSENNCIIVLADGAGSSKHSEVGATLSCKSIIKLLGNDFDEIYNMEAYFAKSKLIHGIRTRLGIKASKYEQTKDEFASTLLFVSIQDDSFIVGHIGDGVVGGVCIDGTVKIISEPENGEFANTTFFTTSDNYQSHFRLHKGKSTQYKAFFLMSDGAADCLYDKKEKKFAPAILAFSSWMKNYEEKEINKALYENMLSMFPQHTSDDCSFIMCQKCNI